MSNTILSGAMRQAEQKAAKSLDGELQHAGETFHLRFSHSEWIYRVTDSSGNFVVNLNVKGLSKAKAALKSWLAS